MLVVGPKSDFPSYLIPITCVLGLSIYYCIIIVPVIWKNVAILVVSSLFSYLLNIFVIVITTFTDPGIIPRRPFLLY